MRPPVPITLRYVARDFDLNGLLLRKGTLIAAYIERMHYRPDIYPYARAFRPERFLDERPGTDTWIPFGGGVHRCIGAGFALTEARLILQTILRTHTFAAETSGGEGSRRNSLLTVPSGNGHRHAIAAASARRCRRRSQGRLHPITSRRPGHRQMGRSRPAPGSPGTRRRTSGPAGTACSTTHGGGHGGKQITPVVPVVPVVPLWPVGPTGPVWPVGPVGVPTPGAVGPVGPEPPGR